MNSKEKDWVKTAGQSCEAVFAFNPIAAQDLRPNQTIAPQRVDAASGVGGSSWNS